MRDDSSNSPAGPVDYPRQQKSSVLFIEPALQLRAARQNQMGNSAVPSEQQKPVERLVERILSAKQRDAGADVSALEEELDKLTYALYVLTPEEVKLVEGAAK